MEEKSNGLIKITELSTQLGLSSRSLRYYEQVGLIQSVRPAFEKYRFFDEANIERLKQIIVLRKMQIPIKDILRIYESESMGVVVETFVNRIRAIDDEIGALTELKRIVGDFLQTMLDNGITKISAIPLLYEEMDKQLGLMEVQKPATYGDLSQLSEKLAKPLAFGIVDLPPCRVLTSFLKPGMSESDYSGFSHYIQINGLSQATSGNHQQFEYQTEDCDVLMVRLPEDFVNDSKYLDYRFDGGLFAVLNLYLDEDLGQCFRALLRELDNNPYWQFAYCDGGDGSTRHPTLIENLISPDDKRELVSMFVPIKKRLPDVALFDAPQEVADISFAEIEAANPVLWAVDVPLDKLTPINNPHYKVLENGEIEYTGWISTRVLSTNVEVKLPFRVDVEFRCMSTGERFSYGDSEGSIILYHGDELSYHYGINMGNRRDMPEEALRFHQPIFKNRYNFHGRGRINKNAYNRLTWFVGAKHLAVFINDELRYCGANFPYMALDLSRETALPIIIGSNGQGMKYFKSIHVSQLAYTPKTKIRKEELTMITKQSNNLIPIIHRLITSEHGENYWFNGCAAYVMECLGEPDYDYWFFAGITGDNFTQHYSHTILASENASGYLAEDNPAQFYESVFLKCGYAATFVSGEDVLKNTEMYSQTLIAYIDKGIPVIRCGGSTGVFVGYEDYGKVLLYITGDKSEPERIALNEVFAPKPFHGYEYKSGWIFVGDKKEQRPLADIYREAIQAIAPMQGIKTDAYCFGAEAFRAWAKDIEDGKFDKVTPEAFDPWCDHCNYVCTLATNSGGCQGFLKKARALNPDMKYLKAVGNIYNRTGEMWNNDNGKDLEALGGGFNVTLEALQNKEKREKIVAKIREFADCMDEVVRILEENQAKM